MIKLSLIVPCFNEEENVAAFYDAVDKAFVNLPENVSDYEIVFVNDGSRDGTAERLKKLYELHSDKIAVVDFSRNFGKEAAVYAGLNRVTGDYIAIIDADLQQRPEFVVDMVNILEENKNYDVVAAYQEQRIEGKGISLLKDMFYKLINKVCETDFYNGASDFRTFRRSVCDAILSVKEYYRFSKGIFSWVGFNTYYMPYDVQERNAGVSKWSLNKLIKYATEGFAAFTTFPLRLPLWLGIGLSALSVIGFILSFVFAITDLFNPVYMFFGSLIVMLSAIQLIMLGFFGEYLAKTYIQGKERPVYIEREFLPVFSSLTESNEQSR